MSSIRHQSCQASNISQGIGHQSGIRHQSCQASVISHIKHQTLVTASDTGQVTGISHVCQTSYISHVKHQTFGMSNIINLLNISLQSSQARTVSQRFEPSYPQRITSGLNTNFTLSSSYFFHKSSYNKSCLFFQPIYIPRALNTETCILQGDLFHSADLHRNHVLAKANTGEIRRGFGKNAGEWNGRVERRRKSLAEACTATY